MSASSILIRQPQFISIAQFAGSNSGNKPNIHKHEYTEIFFVQNGYSEFVINNKSLSAKKGDLLIYNANTEHEDHIYTSSFCQGILLSFNNLLISGREKGHIILPDENPILHLQEKYDTINTSLSEIIKEQCEQNLGYENIISSHLQNVIWIIIRSLNIRAEPNISSLSKKIKSYIENNYDKNLTLNDLSNAVFMSPYHIAHTFKKDFNMSPIKYLIEYRMEKAKELLVESDMSIIEIASKIGYPNSNYFSILFKKLVGKTPGKYRKENIK